MVDFITYNKKQYPVKVGYYAMMMSQQETGKTIKKESDLNFSNFDFFASVLWYSLELGAEVSKKPLALKRSEMKLVLNECFPAFMKIFYNFTMSMNKEELSDIIPVEEEGSKKN
jgi:hypothetical protein